MPAPAPRVLVLSMPKAGTYLVAELLSRAGLRATRLHLNDDSYDDYGSLSFDEGRATPERGRRTGTPIEVAARLGPGEFAVGHLRYAPALEWALAEFRLVFLRRDPRSALVSFVRFLLDSGRADARAVPWREAATPEARFSQFLEHEGEAHMARFRALLPWARHPAVFQMRFEDLVRADAPATCMDVERLLGWLQCAPAVPARELLEQVHATPTITRSSSPGRPRDWWTDAARAWWRRHGGDALVRDYGYPAG